VLGDRCNTDYQPNADEIAEMARLVREGVEAGALGFSTSRTLLHKDLKGVHMPGTFAGSDEMLALGETVAHLAWLLDAGELQRRLGPDGVYRYAITPAPHRPETHW